MLRELILLPPEPGADEDPDDPETPKAGPAEIPAVIDRSHPLWEQVNAEQEELARGK